ncbi:energy-coupling factor transport system ATP-binding protein [Methanohalophilus levihalophilus]|uniref:ATP-binding cassette domain-containing protein n=1 Tax=Methanohalophilus levihalophilus TaxID=1431282 RepID=UPI001AEB2611|nr:ATP-binding cassette domain-containing protein [Methanohalophilus levihalophilus]MBP2030065.1 energy-coupling factor transport system ATP-binding protein [Methanohalophilus levihalophilus]
MIEIKNLSFRYPRSEYILRDVNIRISAGEYVAIVGENGSGKSTLVRHLNGLLLPAEGSVTVSGMPTTDESCLDQIRQKVGMVFQDPMTQFVGATVWEDVAFGPSNLCFSREKMLEAVEASLRAVGLEEFRDASPSLLSGGQMQLAAIAGVLAMEPECLVFDESVSMLDSITRNKIISLIQKLHSDGKTIVHIAHNLDEIRHAERIIALKNGRVLYDGKMATFLEREVFRDAGMAIPQIMDLSLRLKQAGILEDIACDMGTVVEGICRFKSKT